MPMHFRQTSEFAKDLKRLLKKYRTLPGDLEEFKRVVNLQPLGTSTKNFAVLTKQNSCVVIKARLFCRSLKGASLRIIYAYTEKHQQVELIGIELIELYFKGDKANEDRDRIKKYIQSRSK